MAAVYADLIIKGKKTINEVPAKLQDEVKQILIERGYPELAEGDNYVCTLVDHKNIIQEGGE